MKSFNSLVKILSLGVGMAIGLVIPAQVCFQLSYDDCIPELDQVYCVSSLGKLWT